MSWLLTGFTVGATVGSFGSGGGGGYRPSYRELDIGQATEESLLAQTKVAKPMYAAESDDEFGRPAYARLDQKIAIDGLLGEEVVVDRDGYARSVVKTSIPTEADGGIVQSDFHAILKAINPAADFNFKENDPYLGADANALYPWNGSNIDSSFANELESRLSQSDYWTVRSYFASHPDHGADTYEKMVAHFDRQGGSAFYTENMQKYFSGEMDTKVMEILTKAGYEIPERGTAYTKDGEILPTKVEIKETFVGTDKAGQTVRAGGGLLDLITGGRTEELPRIDGSEGTETRKMGHDKDGNFLGIAQTQRDLDSSNQAAKIKSELQLIKDNAAEFTKAYRDQGDIRNALYHVKVLSEGYSAMPETSINTGGTALFDFATGKTEEAPDLTNRVLGLDGQPITKIDKTRYSFSTRRRGDMNITTVVGSDGTEEQFSGATAEESEALAQAFIDDKKNPQPLLDSSASDETVDSGTESTATEGTGLLGTNVRAVSAGEKSEDITTDTTFDEITADTVKSEDIGDMGGLRTSLLTDAEAELELGGDLSEREKRFATQAARSAKTAMGRGRDTSAILEELRLNQELSNQRKVQRQTFATAVAGQEGQLRAIETGQELQAQLANQSSKLTADIKNLDTSELNKDRQLEVDQANQIAAEAYESRKFAADAGNQSVELELDKMARGEAQMAEERQREDKAMALDAMRMDLDRKIQGDIANEQLRQSGLALDFNQAVTRVGLEQSTSADPLVAVTGRASGAEGIGVAGLYETAASSGQTPIMYNPNAGVSFLAGQNADRNTFMSSLYSADTSRDAGRTSMYAQIISAGIQGISRRQNAGAATTATTGGG